MTEQQTNLLLFYKGWDDYQALLIKAITPLSSAQLGLRVAPHLRSIGENVAHIISGRVSNFHIVMGEGELRWLPWKHGTYRARPREVPPSWYMGLSPPGR